MDNHTSLHKNISLAKKYAFIQYFGITSLWLLYLSSFKGMSLVQIGFLEAIFHITSFVFEVPSGALADRFGYKKILLFGKVMAIISSIGMIYGQSFSHFAVAFAFSALSYNFNSGTYEALVFESMKGLDEESGYLDKLAHINFLIEISAQSGVILAGILADTYFQAVYMVNIMLCILNMFLIYRMVEPIKRLDPQLDETVGLSEKVGQSYTRILGNAWQLLKQHKELRGWILFFALLDSFAATYYFYFQNYLSVLGYNGKATSFYLFAAALFGIFGAKFSPSIEKKLRKNRIPYVFPVVVSLSLLLSSLGNQLLIFVGFVLSIIFSAVSPTIASAYINKLIPSEERATLLSANSMAYSLCMIILFPVIGGIIDLLDFQIAYLTMGLSIMVVGGTFAVVAKKRYYRKSAD